MLRYERHFFWRLPPTLWIKSWRSIWKANGGFGEPGLDLVLKSISVYYFGDADSLVSLLYEEISTDWIEALTSHCPPFHEPFMQVANPLFHRVVEDDFEEVWTKITKQVYKEKSVQRDQAWELEKLISVAEKDCLKTCRRHLLSKILRQRQLEMDTIKTGKMLALITKHYLSPWFSLACLFATSLWILKLTLIQIPSPTELGLFKIVYRLPCWQKYASGKHRVYLRSGTNMSVACFVEPLDLLGFGCI